MVKKGLRRFQLLLLLVVGALIVWRMTVSPAGDGFISLTDPGIRSLQSGHFEVREAVSVHLVGEVSFEDDKPGSELAVLAWILDRNTGEPVWGTTPEDVRREGVRALVDDSLRLEPGMYSVYLSTYGPDDDSHRQGSPFGLKPFWTNYESYWRLDLMAPEEAIRVLDRVRDPAPATPHMARISLGDRSEERTLMVHADGASTLRVSGGITRCPTRCDQATMRRLPSGQVVWSLEEANAVPAGGSDINHWLDTKISLPGGVYEFELKPGGHRGRWSENPPWRPDDFVLYFDAGSQGRVTVLDPWADGRPLVDLTRQGDDALVETRITTQDSLDVLIFGMGELRSDSNRYDWGWLEKADNGERIWEMTWENSTPAGGHGDNRQSMAILSLPPGAYVAGYRSDGSHAYGDFNRSKPRFPERWGLAVFALDPGSIRADRVQVERIQRAEQVEERVVTVGSALSGISEDRFVVRLTSLGHNKDVSTVFELSDSTGVIIQALGEITTSSAYDYGWIETMPNGERIWEMTWENTTSAGDNDSFRSARVEMTLAPGRYRAHFHTDGSVSYEDFGSELPDNPEDWGIAIFRAE